MSSSLDEQLALFEKEVLSNVDVARPSVPAKDNEQAKQEAPIQGHEIGGSCQPTLTKFVPHQLRLGGHPLAQHFAPRPSMSMAPPVPAVSQAVIESGPTLYLQPSSSSSSTKTTTAANTKPTSSAAESTSSTTASSNSTIAMLQQQQQSNMKTLALPSDVELLLAKKQATKAHENSYLGAVLRGEKKMKKFVRSCGGQIWEDPSMAEWDTSDFRIFCGDLGNEVSDELLAKAFRKYPSFQKAKVVRDSRTNKSKGFGFVSFKNQDDFIRAMKEMDGKYVGNRPIKLRKSNWKERNLDMVKKKQKEKKKLGLV